MSISGMALSLRNRLRTSSKLVCAHERGISMRTVVVALMLLFSQMASVQASDRKSLQLAPTTTITGNAPGLRVLIVVTTREVKTRELIGSRFRQGNFPELTTIVQNITLTVTGKICLCLRQRLWIYIGFMKQSLRLLEILQP